MLSLHLLSGRGELLCRLTFPAIPSAPGQRPSRLYLIASPHPPYLRWLRLYRCPVHQPDELPPAA
jgi:hypothetical protein